MRTKVEEIRKKYRRGIYDAPKAKVEICKVLFAFGFDRTLGFCIDMDYADYVLQYGL